MLRKRNALLESAKAAQIDCFSLAPACATLAAHLVSGNFDKTDPALWDDFLAFYRMYLRHRANDSRPNFRIAYHYNCAGMSVQHPRRPQYGPMLNFLRTNLSSTTNEEIRTFREFIPARDQFFPHHFNVTARLAVEDGQIEIAAWIKDLTPRFMNLLRK